MKQFFLFILIIGSLCSCPSTPDVQIQESDNFPTIEEGLGSIADTITKQLAQKEAIRIAILEFTDSDGESGALGTYLTNELITGIFRIEHNYSIVERQNLKKIVDEHTLSKTGLIDESTAGEIGSFVGADAVAISSYHPYETFVKIDTRLVDVETGELIAAASAKIAALSEFAMVDPSIAPQEVSEPSRIERTSVVIRTNQQKENPYQSFLELIADETAREMGNAEIIWEYNPEDLQDSNEQDLPHLLYNHATMEGLWTAGILQSLNGIVDPGLVDEYLWEANAADGDIWSIPVIVGNHLMLYYNKNLIAKAPATTGDLLNCRDRVPSGIIPLVFTDRVPFYLIPWYHGFGGELFSLNGSIPNLSNPSMIQTFQFYFDLYKNRIIPPFDSYSYGETVDEFLNGRAAMILIGDWVFDNFIGHFKDDLGVALMPLVEGTGKVPSPFISTHSFALTRASGEFHKEFFNRFINKLWDDDVQEMFLTHYNRFPVKGSYDDHWIFKENELLAASYKQMKNGIVMRGNDQMRAVWDAMLDYVPRILENPENLETAVQEMQKNAVDILRN